MRILPVGVAGYGGKRFHWYRYAMLAPLMDNEIPGGKSRSQACPVRNTGTSSVYTASVARLEEGLVTFNNVESREFTRSKLPDETSGVKKEIGTLFD